MGWQNFYATRLSVEIGTSDTTLTVDTAPSKTSGRLVLEARNPTKREIISYTGVSGNDLTGVTRGEGGTTAKTHNAGALVEMNLVAEDLEDALAVPSDIITRFDESLTDFVASGMVWSQTTLLVGEMTAGVIYVDGYRREVDAISGKSFGASKDTYIDFDNTGAVDYNEVANGAAAPSLAANNIRVAKVVTDGTTITGVTDLRPQASVTGTRGLLGDTHRYTYDGTDIFVDGVDQNNAANTISWVKPAGLKFIEVELVGGGGGGGGVAGTAGQAAAAGGGGAGGYSMKRILAASLSATETVTVGAKGAGGAAGNNAGSAGGTTSFGSHLQATGGGAGQATSGTPSEASGGNPGVGGVGSDGDLNTRGGHASWSSRFGGSTDWTNGSFGGRSHFGEGGYAHGQADSEDGEDAVSPGAGGGGAVADASVNRAGGDGAAGIVIVREYF